jgi:hypothetical protein
MQTFFCPRAWWSNIWPCFDYFAFILKPHNMLRAIQKLSGTSTTLTLH